MKTIGVEITRRYVLSVNDLVNTDNWAEMGLLLSQQRVVPPAEVEMLAWELPDGDIQSRASDRKYEEAHRQRILTAMDMFDGDVMRRGKRITGD